MLLDECGKICYYECLLVSNVLLKNAIGLEITMYHLLLVNKIQRDADHCKYSQYALFRNNFIFVVCDYFRQTLVVLFHYYPWKFIFIFDQIYHTHDHWMLKSSQPTDFLFSYCNSLSSVKSIANLIFKSFSSVSFPINFTLNLEDNFLFSLFKNSS